MNLSGLMQPQTIFFIVVSIWSLMWKGLALYRCANLKQKNWFIGLLLINTMGILEITYLFFFAKNKLTLKELKSWRFK